MNQILLWKRSFHSKRQVLPLAEYIISSAPSVFHRYFFIKAQNEIFYNADIHFLRSDFVLPNSLIAIKENAFSGGAFTFVQLPDNALSIGSGAFSNCRNLWYIIIPESVDNIADTAFENGVMIIGVPDSTAYEYASSKTLQFIPIG